MTLNDSDLRLADARRFLDTGNALRALAACEEAMAQQDGETVAAWRLKCETLLTLGRLGDVIESATRGLAVDAADPDLLVMRAAANQGLRSFDAALADYRRILELNPGYADAENNIGRIFGEQQDYAKAMEHFDAAIRINPGHAEAFSNRGLALRALGRHAEALACFRQALKVRPNYLDAIRNEADTLREMKRWDEALECYSLGLTRFPDSPDLINNRGGTLLAIGRYADALACYDRVLELQPNNPGALSNRGAVLEAFGRMDEAEASLRAALAIEPNRVGAHWNLALCLLRLGRLAEGWPEHEWRRKKVSFKNSQPSFTQPFWDGTTPLDGKTILITAEQGLGDTLQFVRYTRQLEKSGAKVVLLVQDPLVDLISCSFPRAKVLGPAHDMPEFDLQCPMLSLPLAFGTRLETIPREVPYLVASPTRMEAWSRKLPRTSSLRIGLAWAGNPDHSNDLHRSIRLQALKPILEFESCEFLVLQKQVSDEDRKILGNYSNTKILGPDLENFSETAAIVSGVDLVISVDTSLAHLAAGMGKATWILIPPHSDWRWMLNRTDSPWYPTMRLYRRPLDADWGRVVNQVCDDLRLRASIESTPVSRTSSTDIQGALKTAIAFHNSGNLADAMALYRGVMQLDPKNFDAYHLLGLACAKAKQHAEAESLIRHALELRPQDTKALGSLTRVLNAMGKPAEAMPFHDRLLELEPGNAEFLSERGISLISLGRNEDALIDIEKALKINPRHPHASNNLGAVLIQLGRHAEALAALDRVLEDRPDAADAIGNRGLALLGLGRAREAIDHYRHGLTVHPDSTTMMCNLGISLMALMQHGEAIQLFRRAIAIEPSSLDANWNLALALLSSGNYADGWKQYEWRWKRSVMAPHIRKFNVPAWTGREPLQGRRLFVHFEQGYGDTLQFLRYVPLLEARGAKVIIYSPEPMRSLVEASFPEAECVAGSDSLPGADMHIPMMSLPLAFGTLVGTIPPADKPYLTVPQASLARWRDRLAGDSAFKVGLAWSGNPGHAQDRIRSLSLDCLRPLLEVRGASFYCLQKDIRPADAELLKSLPQVKVISNEFEDFSDTAAAIEQLDLVVSVDTSVAHLAGALCRKTWLVLPRSADWRWLANRHDSPWYASFRLFRANEPGPPIAAIRLVAAQLQNLIGKGQT